MTLHPNEKNVEIAIITRGAGSQLVRGQMLFHFLPPAYPRSKAFGEHGAPAPYPRTWRLQGCLAAICPCRTQMEERGNLLFPHAAFPRPIDKAENLPVLHAKLYPIDGTAESVSPAHGADSQPVS